MPDSREFPRPGIPEGFWGILSVTEGKKAVIASEAKQSPHLNSRLLRRFTPRNDTETTVSARDRMITYSAKISLTQSRTSMNNQPPMSQKSRKKPKKIKWV